MGVYLLNNMTNMKTNKIQMKDIQIGDVVVVRYAEQKAFAKVDSITEYFQKNGVRIVSLWRSDDEVAMGKSKGIWEAKETTFMQKVN
jgi:hypothetical protein